MYAASGADFPLATAPLSSAAGTPAGTAGAPSPAGTPDATSAITPTPDAATDSGSTATTRLTLNSARSRSGGAGVPYLAATIALVLLIGLGGGALWWRRRPGSSAA